MPKDTKTLGNSKARACESLGFVHKKGCARVLTQPRGYTIKIILNRDYSFPYENYFKTSANFVCNSSPCNPRAMIVPSPSINTV